VRNTNVPAYEIHSYSADVLIELTARLSGGKNTVAEIRAKHHPKYLDGYFKYLGVKTVVVERQYVDRDYLEDFAAY